LDHHPFKAADRRKLGPSCASCRAVKKGRLETGGPKQGFIAIDQQMRRGCGVSFHQQRT
jgi:hypothetical protein